jgi:hypothetical protein
MITEFKLFENKVFNEYVRLLDEFSIVMKKFMEDFFVSELKEYQMKVGILQPHSAAIILKMEGDTDLNPILNIYLYNYVKRSIKNQDLKEKVYKLEISRRYTTDDIFNAKLKSFEKFIDHLTNHEKLNMNELKNLISKLNMEEYNLITDINKYNL